MKKPCENFEGLAQFTRREGGQGAGRLGNFFLRVLLQGSGRGLFYHFFETNFENLICDGKLFENRDMREVQKEILEGKFIGCEKIFII